MDGRFFLVGVTDISEDTEVFHKNPVEVRSFAFDGTSQPVYE
jgi:hypothetical protein